MQEETKPMANGAETAEVNEEATVPQTVKGTEGAGEKEKPAVPEKPWHNSDGAVTAATPQPKTDPAPVQEEKSPRPGKTVPGGGPTPDKPVKRPRHKDKILHMDYKLSYEHVYETFTLLGQKSRTLRTVQIATLVLAVLCSLLAYFIDEGNFMFLLAIVVFFIVAGYLLFVPDNKRKKQATKVMEMDPTYKLKIYSDGSLESPLQGKVKMEEDKKAISFEGPNVFAIGLQGKYSYCIPKSYLDEAETQALREVLQAKTRFRKEEKLRK